MASNPHPDAVFVDGLQICDWGRPVFEQMREAGLTAVNCTCSVWEGFEATLANLAVWQRRFAEDADLIRQVRTVADVETARLEGRTGVFLGFQNSWAVEDRLERLGLFHELGVRVIQVTYNTQNLAGSGCWESRDGGLSDYGRDLVAEMNRLGILADLSHVGPRTSHDVVEASTAPVVYSHVCPAARNPHPRNKSDEQMRHVAEKGGLVGVTLLPWFLRADGRATLDDYLDAIEHVIGVVGEEQVGIGTDYMQGHGLGFLEWLRRDKGTGRLLAPVPGPDEPYVAAPEGLEEVRDLARLPGAMERRGWDDERILRVLGRNWLRVLGDVWR